MAVSTAAEAACLIDVDSLLIPIDGDDPAGDPKAYAYGLRDRLVELRREERPEDFDDATRPAELKRPDWQGIISQASEALRTETKDLRVACHLVEAIARSKGFAGLRDGLLLLRRLVDECWDRLNPPIEEGDLEVRSDPLANSLDDPHRGVCFPNTVKTLPLIGPPEHSLGLIQWNRARQSRDPRIGEELARTLVQTPSDQTQQTIQDIDQCLGELDQLVAVLDSRFGEEAPGLTNLRAALDECWETICQGMASFTANSGLGERPTRKTSAKTPAPAGDVTPVPSISGSEQAVLLRAEAYSQLKRAAETLERLEPHSPIPHLVKRCVQLGQLPFPKLMEQLIRDSNVLNELNRELGVYQSAGDRESSDG